MAKTRKTTNAANSKLSLSAAILAPLNSIFEAQVQSARAFLNFILQLGFKEQPSASQLDAAENQLKADGQWTNETDEHFQKLRSVQSLKSELATIKAKPTKSDDDRTRIGEINQQLADVGHHEDAHMQSFRYKDGQGAYHQIEIPALALVPVKPLSIESADYEFSMSIDSAYENYSQNQKTSVVKEDRPWFFIKPKRFTGSIASKDSEQTQSTVKVKVHLESSPIPQGLSNLLVSLTQSGRTTSDED